MAPFIIAYTTSMSDPDRNSNSSDRGGNLEEWLQLPDSDDDSEPSGQLDEFDESETQVDFLPARPDEASSPPKHQINKDGVLTLFPPEEQISDPQPDLDDISRPKTDSQDNDVSDSSGAEAPASVDDDSPVEMENLLNREFGDTLTGTNAVTLPLGFLLILLSIVAWFMNPILQALGLGQISTDQALVPLISSVLLALGGMHLVFYWLIHRISNAVKSRELDRLIDSRRIHRMCIHLDCTEAVLVDDEYDSGDEESFEPEDAGKPEAAEQLIELIWRCRLFDIDVEEMPICAVCDRYEYRRDASRNENPCGAQGI